MTVVVVVVVAVAAAVSVSLPLTMHTKLHCGILACRVSSFRCSVDGGGGAAAFVGTKRKAMDAVAG